MRAHEVQRIGQTRGVATTAVLRRPPLTWRPDVMKYDKVDRAFTGLLVVCAVALTFIAVRRLALLKHRSRSWSSLTSSVRSARVLRALSCRCDRSILETYVSSSATFQLGSCIPKRRRLRPPPNVQQNAGPSRRFTISCL